ncbi:Uma2 family endonuclease [Phormidesmis priestleyi ULC007]|uniref:Uma2 family endonuclease n=1 Tax=Phormidesmis priestleyi ULC007 TaxID=1920490 RepID=A0A2T1D4F6_9CYAN|nr:Uma2 family endonuclease [Phormidesmis priestleyi]PSB15360.1 Uma2 family endonuclease [Phormidesmis priestleyi ULC007]PZO51589.1 MAG: Uma2 family endonuclease [Phormidesmis priestleyi]
MNSPVLEKPTRQNSVLLYNLTWDALERLDVELEGTGARLIYLDGFLEITAPFFEEHEEPKCTVSRLIEAFMRERGIRFYIRGSTTLGKRKDGARREPDESYSLGTKKPIPDLVLEITVTSGGISKLEIYKRLKVPEVWFWEDGTISAYCLQENGYERVAQSSLLPDLDLVVLAQYSRMADQYDAVNEFTQVIRGM